MVRWPTPTAGQNIRVAQAGCLYAVSRSAFSFASNGGSGTFDVIQRASRTRAAARRRVGVYGRPFPTCCGSPSRAACRGPATTRCPLQSRRRWRGVPRGKNHGARQGRRRHPDWPMTRTMRLCEKALLRSLGARTPCVGRGHGPAAPQLFSGVQPSAGMLRETGTPRRPRRREGSRTSACGQRETGQARQSSPASRSAPCGRNR
jgi:hypothetical protein